MNKLLYLTLIALTVILIGCSNDDEPELMNIGHSIYVHGEDGDGIPASVESIGDDIYLGLTPEAQQVTIEFLAETTIDIVVKGEFDSWISYDTYRNQLLINVEAFPGYAPDASLSTQFKVNVSAKGYNTTEFTIHIKQSADTYPELLAKEEQAIDYFLSKQTVKDWPTDNNIDCGENAPYYKLGDTGVYMKVTDKGEHPFNRNERVYFRYEQYDLFTFMKSGELGTPIGIMDPSATPIFFQAYSQTYPYGKGIQLPLEYGVNDGDVYLVIPSPLGMTRTLVTPFLYHVIYKNPDY